MKKLLSLLALAALLPVSANADVLKNVNLKGDIQTITSDVNHNMVVAVDPITGENVKNYNEGTSVRVLAGLSADLVEDVTANLMFQYANVWGNDVSTGKTVNQYWNDVRLVEANVVLHNLFCCLEATVGRQFYGDEDSAVMYIGPNHYNAEFNGLTNSLDAAKVTYGDDVKALTLIAGRIKMVDDDLVDPTIVVDEVDATLIGGDFKLNLTDALKLQAYAYNFSDMKFTDHTVFPALVYPVDGNGGFYGAKLGFDGEAVRMAAEYARNSGFRNGLFKENKDTGHMVKVDLATDIKAVTARGAFLYANEGFWALGNYTPGLLIGHRLGGDIFDYSNNGVAMFNLGFDVKPADKWTVSLDGYSFQDHRMDHSSTWEGDVTVKYAHNEYVELFAGAGYAKYTSWDGTDYNRDNYNKDNVKGQLGMLIKF